MRRLNAEYVKLFGEPAFQRFLDEQGVQNGMGSLEEFAKILKKDREDAAMFVKKYNFAVQ